MNKENFWEKWSEHFPVSAAYSDGEGTGMPEGVTFERAGQSVFLSLEELWILTYGRQKEPEYECGWAGDARATTFYDTQEEAEEYMGDPKRFRRHKAGEWKEV